MPELLVILVVALLVLGPKRLPEIAKSLGRGIAEFRKASNEMRSAVSTEPPPEPTPTPIQLPPAPAPQTPELFTADTTGDEATVAAQAADALDTAAKAQGDAASEAAEEDGTTVAADGETAAGDAPAAEARRDEDGTHHA